jgi:hypothetical protein
VDTFIFWVGDTISGSVVLNDYDNENHQLTTTLLSSPLSTHGTLSFNSDGVFNYGSSHTFFGIDSFQYQVCDNGFPSLCDTAYVYFDIRLNDAPIAVNDNFNPQLTNPSTWNVLSNDFDINGDHLAVVLPVTQPNYGTITMQANGYFTYAQSQPFTGLDSFQYTMCDDGFPQLCNTATVYLASFHNDAPVAVNDTFNTLAANPLPWNILANDYDLNGDNIILSLPIVQPNYGIVSMQTDGTFTYNQLQGFNGLDSFQYTICDNGMPQLCALATVYISGYLPLVVDSVFVVGKNCNDTTGSITVHVSGGAGGYEFSKDANLTWQTSNVFTGLSQGSYTISVRDSDFNYAYPNITPTIISGLLQPQLVNSTYQSDSLVLQTNISNAEFSLDCGNTWQSSNVFHPNIGGNFCIGIRHANDSCEAYFNIQVNNTPPVAVADTFYTRPDSLSYWNLPLRDTFQILTNDFDLENNTLFVQPDTLLGSGSFPISFVDSFGNVAIYTHLALNNGLTFHTYSYQVCELYQPTNCTIGSYNIFIAPPSSDSLDVISDTIAIGTNTTICITKEELLGNIDSIVLITPALNVVLDSISQDSCLHWYADNYGSDTITIVFCDVYGFCDTIYYQITVADGVWPGDTDDDTKVDNFDLLNIGLGYGTAGTPRDSVSIVWNGFITPKWNIATPSSNVDYRHLDCNGDGVINATDTMAIIQNWGRNYQRGGGGVLGGVPIKVDTTNLSPNLPKFTLPIVLGDMANPAIDVYGGAFSISYDTNYIKKDSVFITFDTSFVGIHHLNMISIQKNFGHQQRIDAAFTRINGINVTGFGIIGKLNFTIKDDILRPIAGDSINLLFNVFDTKFISYDESDIPVDEQTTGIVLSNKKNPVELGKFIEVFPNPTRNHINILSHQLSIEHISITDVNGRIVFSQNTTNRNNHQLRLELASGVYSIHLKTNKGISVKRLVVIK